MDIKNCKTCKSDSIVGLDIFGIHICTNCVDLIKNLEVNDTNYEYYKGTICKAWSRHNGMELK